MSGLTWHSVAKDWYSSKRWRKFRLQFLHENPLCQFCKQDGRLAPATVVDHVDPHKGDIVKFWQGPFQALCKAHHDGAKKSAEMTGTMRGCDEQGNPIGRAW
jgi:5-methylcytosine-specific restriction enzyme A